MTQTIIHPEVEILRKKLEDIRAESARTYLKMEYMQFEEKPLLYSLYEANIGKLEFEEFQIKIQLQLTAYETKLVQAYINRSERIDFDHIDEQVQYAKMKYKDDIEQKEAEIKAAQDYLNAPVFSIEESNELRELYRMIVKALHPDLHPEQTQKEKDIFLKAISAYRIGDIYVMRQIALSLTEEAIEDIPEMDLPHLIEQAHKTLNSFQERIKEMNKRFPFIYRDQLKDEEWIKGQLAELTERIVNAKARLKKARNYLSTLKLWQHPNSLN